MSVEQWEIDALSKRMEEMEARLTRMEERLTRMERDSDMPPAARYAVSYIRRLEKRLDEMEDWKELHNHPTGEKA